MKISTRRERGRPVFLHSGGMVISLVQESLVRELQIGGSSGKFISTTKPGHIYVLDAGGMERLSIPATGWARLALFCAAILGPLYFVLLRRRVKHYG